ncbi:hypothetical protein HED60_04425 [Planctomycetales bacterium ZRK34]|nr:hypothetical protein HED60_04425 [Planctomycetales bacterium ZRK34]
MMTSRSSHRGFVLILTLVLIVIASVTLAAVARRSMATALNAQCHQDDLQRHWGTLSLTAAILPHAEQILKTAEQDLDQPVAHVNIQCLLGDMAFELTLADEQAKANVNTLLATRSRRSVYDNVRQLATDSDTALPPEVRSLAIFDAGKHDKKIQSFGELFETCSTASLHAAAAQLTCWGNGKLHWHRTPPLVLREVLEPLADHTAIQQLIDLRQMDVVPNVNEAIAGLEDVNKSSRQALTRLLTETSGCHSLWITMTDKHRQWDHLAVLETAHDRQPGGKTAQWHFEW